MEFSSRQTLIPLSAPLRNRHGGKVTINGLSTVLNNPFYIGIIRIEKTNETFAGIHEPLVGKMLFDRVQAVLTGKVHAKVQRHDHIYRRLLTCSRCNYSLIAERQKGRVYYRCHTRHSPHSSIREDVVEVELSRFFGKIRFNENERAYFKARIPEMRKNWANQQQELVKSLGLKLAQIKDRFNRLTEVKTIKNTRALRQAIAHGRREFLVCLTGGIVSRKTITACACGRFKVLNHVDGSIQRLTARQLHSHSIIGDAMRARAFMVEETRP